MVDEATLQAQLDAELDEHLAAGRAIYYGDRRLAAGGIKEYPDGRREAGAVEAQGDEPSHSTVAGVSAPTPALASACLNASDAVAWPLRAKAKRCWAPRASITLPATTSKWRSGRCRLRT